MELDELLKSIQDHIKSIKNFDEKVKTINKIREEISSVSPFREEPVDCVLWTKADRVFANDYNPNHVAPPEMQLLYVSVNQDGFTMPIVTGTVVKGKRVIVDGFHRNRVGREYPDITKRLHGYLPVTTLDKKDEDLMASTIRHNRARGTHGIRPMSDIVLELTQYGWSDQKICDQLGMEPDEVIRLKQITGLKDAFSHHEFSKSWEQFENKYYKK